MDKYSAYSDLKIFYHTDRLKGLINGERVAPVYVRIKPTNVCNQNCFYCGYANDRVREGRNVNRKESIPWDIMQKLLHDLQDMGVKALTYSGGGEPLCYHSIAETLEMTKKLGMDYSIITNGQALEGDNALYLKDASWIRVSFDSVSGEVYGRIRGVGTGNYERIVRNIGNFAKIKSSDCTLGINCVVTRENAGEVYELCRLAKELGVDNIKFSPIMVKDAGENYHGEIREKVQEQIIKAKETLEEEKGFRIVDKYTCDLDLTGNPDKSYHRCWIQEVFAVVGADSKVYRCHPKAYTVDGEIGDLGQNTFKEIWYSQDNIKKIRDFDPCQKCRFRCTFDERNNLLDEFLSMDRKHVNFI